MIWRFGQLEIGRKNAGTYRPGHKPHNKGKSNCPHGVGNMSKCAECRKEKDRAYYARLKGRPEAWAKKKARDSRYPVSRNTPAGCCMQASCT